MGIQSASQHLLGSRICLAKLLDHISFTRTLRHALVRPGLNPARALGSILKWHGNCVRRHSYFRRLNERWRWTRHQADVFFGCPWGVSNEKPTGLHAELAEPGSLSSCAPDLSGKLSVGECTPFRLAQKETKMLITSIGMICFVGSFAAVGAEQAASQKERQDWGQTLLAEVI